MGILEQTSLNIPQMRVTSPEPNMITWRDSLNNLILLWR